MMEPFRCIADLRGELMESPVWDDRRQTLFACDIEGRRIYEIDLDRGRFANGLSTARWQASD